MVEETPERLAAYGSITDDVRLHDFDGGDEVEVFVPTDPPDAADPPADPPAELPANATKQRSVTGTAAAVVGTTETAPKGVQGQWRCGVVMYVEHPLLTIRLMEDGLSAAATRDLRDVEPDKERKVHPFSDELCRITKAPKERVDGLTA